MQNEELDETGNEEIQGNEPAPGPRKPNIRLRQNMTFEHHLFGSDVQNCLKNTSYKKYHPELREVPHKHFFHTKDMRGKSLNKSSHACGHYHVMTWRMDPQTGDLIAESGIALRDATIRYEDGSRETRPEECTWSNKKREIQRDNHRHSWTYLGTDILSPGILKQNREANQEEAASYGVNVNAGVKPMAQARPFTAEDGITVRER